MAVCINKNSVEYQSLKDKAGISEFTLEAVCRDFMDKYGRFPHLDELPNSNSEPHFINNFNVRKDGGVKVSKVLEQTGKGTIEEAVIDINNSYRDLEVQILPIEEMAIVDIQHRPSTNNFEEVEQIIPDNNPNSTLIFSNALEKLASLYGITFNEISDVELHSSEWINKIPDVDSVNAFVYNGQIYINTDKANIDAPIHEMFHILVGSMRFENPNMYAQLIENAEKLKNYEALASQYRGRSRNDINEEILITELARAFSGLPSEFTTLDPKLVHEISYSVKRTLDSILMGSDSVNTISEDRLYNMTFKDVIKDINSSIATSKFKGFINVEGSELHRKLNNIKSDLLRNNTLEEICD